jgi:hypothetical protein
MSKLSFIQRRSPVLAEHRNIFKISQILLILHLCSRSGKASIPKLQLFNWALKKPHRQASLLNSTESSGLSITAWGFDPVLTIALKFAVAENLIDITSTGYGITDYGLIFAEKIMADTSLLKNEKKSLSAIGKSINESMIEAITKSWKTS